MTIHYDLTEAAYRDGSHFGIHSLMDFARRGPRYFYGRHVTGIIADQDNVDYSFGRAAHSYILEGERVFSGHFAVRPETYPDKKTGEPKPWHAGAGYCKDWTQTAHGRGLQVIKSADLDHICNMDDCIREHPTASRLLHHDKGLPEVAIRQEINGLPVQCRADFVLGGSDPSTWTAIVDLKTVHDLGEFKRQATRFGYWWQSSFYSTLFSLEVGRWLPFWFVAVEKSPSYRVGVYRFDPAVDQMAAQGEHGWSSVIDSIQTCVDLADWPNTPNDEHEIMELPEWMMEREGALA